MTDPVNVYYADYEPRNASHFRDMLNQFRKAPTQRDMEMMLLLWIWSPSVAREDIVVAHGRVERERGWHDVAPVAP